MTEFLLTVGFSVLLLLIVSVKLKSKGFRINDNVIVLQAVILAVISLALMVIG